MEKEKHLLFKHELSRIEFEVNKFKKNATGIISFDLLEKHRDGVESFIKELSDKLETKTHEVYVNLKCLHCSEDVHRLYASRKKLEKYYKTLLDAFLTEQSRIRKYKKTHPSERS